MLELNEAQKSISAIESILDVITQRKTEMNALLDALEATTGAIENEPAQEYEDFDDAKRREM